MKMIDMHEAKSNLPSLVQDALNGEEIIIAIAGSPAVKLVPVNAEPTPRVPGALKGQIWLATDFQNTPEGIVNAFETDRPTMRLRLDTHISLWWCSDKSR